MNNKKITAFVTLALVGATIIPTNAIAKSKENKIVLAQNNIASQNINFYNIWGGISAQVSFNPQTMKISAVRKSGNLGNGNNNYIDLVYYNSKENKVDINQQVIDGNSSDLTELLNDKSFNYGDIIGVKFEENTSAPIVSNNGKIENNGQMRYFEITENGLIQYTPKISVNSLNILTGDKVTSAKVTGSGAKNQIVTATVNGQTFSGETNENGDFSININDNSGFSKHTQITLHIPCKVGEVEKIITPTLAAGVDINKNQIILNNVWSQYIGTIGFSPENKTMAFTGGWAEINPYLSSNSKAFNITLYDKTGKLEKSLDIYGGEHPQDVLNKFFNNVPFEYGSYIQINYVTSSKLSITNFNNQKQYPINKTILLKITKQGLIQSNLNTVDVNSFDILNGKNPKSGNLTGMALANSKVQVTVEGQTFDTIASNSGKFSINISDVKGFTKDTLVNVWAENEIGKVIYPVAPTNWEIKNSKIQLPDSSLGIAQTLTFNPTQMTIQNSGSGFAVQLIDGKTGNMVASAASGNFNVFKSQNNINGATFKFGDIINIYESEETYLSDGGINIYNSNNKNTISPINKFESFEISQNGLIPVLNKNLTDVNAIYTGDSIIKLTGKTTPNTNVQIYYGNNHMQTIKSNSQGEFLSSLSSNDAPVGSEIRVFVNNENSSAVVIGYDSKEFNNNNSVQIVNSAAFPVINLMFSPSTNTITSMIYPQDKTYAGVFYGNKINISLIDSKTGEILKNITSAKQGEIETFSNQLNGLKYNEGDILKVEYNNKFSSVNIFDGGKIIGNTTGQIEYFEITNKGLINVTNKFIQVNPLDILGIGNGNIKNTIIVGKVSPNENVTAIINGKSFTTESNNQGTFNLNISDENNFTSNTEIKLSANGYNTTYIKPTISTSLNLSNSYLNFYQNTINWETSGLCSSVGFDLNNNTFVVNNYNDNFGTGKSTYFTLSLYNSQGEQLLNKSFTGESTNDLTKFLNGKSFSYGDIIGLNYNAQTYKPIVINGNTAIGNVTGETEYFEITKKGLLRVNFGKEAIADNVIWNNENLEITANLVYGNSINKDSNEKLVLLNSDKQIIASQNATSNNVNGKQLVTGMLTNDELTKIDNGQTYSIAVEINNEIIPIYTDCNTPNYENYILNGSSNNQLTVQKSNDYINIKDSNEIDSYLNQSIKAIDGTSMNQLNNETENKVLAVAFINRIGVGNLESFYNKSAQNAEFINWVLNNSTAMQEFLSGPNPEGIHLPEGQPRATYTDCLQVWSNIWNTYKNSHSGFNLKLAIAVSLTNGQTIWAFPSGKPVGNPVERYNIFETLKANGGMLKGFDELDVSHLCYVVNVGIANDEIIPMRSIILQNHNWLVKSGELNNIAYTIHYNTRNPHTGASVFGRDFYGKNPTINDIWYDGGVCGATGRLGAFGENLFGIPAVQTPQPGHNAFIYYNLENKSWNLGNNISGWEKTYDADLSGWSNTLNPNNNMIASYTPLYQAADNGTLQKSNMYLYLAQAQSTYANKLNLINQAIKVDPLNMGAFIQLIDLYNSNASITLNQYNDLAANINETFKNYTMPKNNLISYLYNSLLKEKINQAQNILNNTSNNKSSMEVLKPGINNANNTLNNTNSTQQEIISAINNLDNIINNLSINNNTETIYWTTINGEKYLVINGDITGVGSINENISKNLVLEDSNGQIVKTINTTPVNWYSNDKNNYNGYQGIISESELSSLEANGKYNIGIEYNGKMYKLKFANQQMQANNYNIQDNDGYLNISKINESTVNSNSTCENMYSINNGIILNTKFNLNNKEIEQNTKMNFIITNQENEIIYSGNAIPVNWYSDNKDNYNGAQIFIPYSITSKLKNTEKYNIQIKVVQGNQEYEMSIYSNDKNINLDNYSINANSEGSLVIDASLKKINNATATIKNDYTDGSNRVFNVELNIPNMDINSNAELEFENDKKEIDSVRGILVNWYSNKKSIYNGAQFIINKNELKNIKSVNLNVKVNNEIYKVNFII